MSQTVRSVIVLNDFCCVQGGASKVAVDEAIALADAGLDVTFLGAVGPVAERLRDSAAQVVCLDQTELADAGRKPAAAFRALWNQQAYRRVQQILVGKDPVGTIVHLHGYTKALTAAPMLAARRAGFTGICTLHDFFAACPNGAFYDYRREEPCSERGLSMGCMLRSCDKRHPIHKAYRVVRGLAQRHVAQFPATVSEFITLSRRSAELLGPYLPAGARLHPLPNIIDVPRGRPVRVAANSSLVVLGRLDAEKGVLLAAKAAADLELPLVFIGDGPLRAEVEGLGARVTGWLGAEGVDQELRQARCLIFPSAWYETFGLVVAEAAARGIPSIVSDISAAAERVRDGITGWVFQSGNMAQLKERMRLLADDDQVSAAGQAAYQDFWSAPPDRARHTAALIGIYEAALSRQSAVPARPNLVSNSAILEAS